MRRRSFCAFFSVLLLCLFLVACSGSTLVALIDAGVAAFEAIMPAIPNLSTDQQQAVSTYINAGLAIFTELIDNGVNTGSLAVAVDKAAKLVAPAVGPPAGPLIYAADNALHAFISAAQGATVTAENLDPRVSLMIHAAFPPGTTIKLSSKHLAKLATISKRAHASRDRLRGAK